MLALLHKFLNLPKAHPFISSAVGVLIVGAAGTCAWLLSYYNNHPQKILADAITKLAQAPSSGFSGVYRIHPKGQDSQQLTVTFKGQASQNQAQSDINVTIGPTQIQTQLITTNNTTYVRLLNAAALAENLPKDTLLAPFAAQFRNAAAYLQDKWLKLGATNSTSTPTGCINSLGAKPLMAEQRKEIIGLFRTSQFVTAEKLPAEVLQGRQAIHLKLTLDAAKMQQFAQELLKREPFKSNGECLKPFTAQTTLQKTIPSAIDLWVDARSREPLKLEIEAANNTTQISSTLELELGRQTTISAPAASETVDLTDLLKLILNPFGKS